MGEVCIEGKCVLDCSKQRINGQSVDSAAIQSLAAVTLTACGDQCCEQCCDGTVCAGATDVCCEGENRFCAAGQTCCPGLTCANIGTDPRNCGGCNNDCATLKGEGSACCNGNCCDPGQTRENGQCVGCPTGKTPCPTTNGTICCETGQVCSNGICCPTGQTNCQGTCCDGTCCNDGCHPAGYHCCSDGGACPSDQTCCGSGTCANIYTDPQNCGGCNTVCSNPDYPDCCYGCTNLKWSFYNCSTCGNQCTFQKPDGGLINTSCCNGICVKPGEQCCAPAAGIICPVGTFCSYLGNGRCCAEGSNPYC